MIVRRRKRNVLLILYYCTVPVLGWIRILDQSMYNVYVFLLMRTINPIFDLIFNVRPFRQYFYYILISSVIFYFFKQIYPSYCRSVGTFKICIPKARFINSKKI